MKLVIPTNSNVGLDDLIAEHFGRCLTFTFLDESGEVIKIIKNTSQHMGGADLPPQLMKKHNANILLCKNLGPKAIELCDDLNISVYTDPTESKTVKDIFQKWQNNKLIKASLKNACPDHKK